MELKSLIVVLLGVTLCVIVTQCRKQTKGRRSQIVKNKWYRDINANVTVKEAAAILKSRERIFFKSADRKLRKTAITRSVSYIDNSSEFMVIKAYIAGSRKCLVLPGNLTQDFNTTVEDILTRKTVNETVGVGEFMMTSDTVMSQTERDDFKGDSRFLARKCRRNEMLNVTLPFTDTSDILDKYPVTLLTLGGTVTVYISAVLGIGPL